MPSTSPTLLARLAREPEGPGRRPLLQTIRRGPGRDRDPGPASCARRSRPHPAHRGCQRDRPPQRRRDPRAGADRPRHRGRRRHRARRRHAQPRATAPRGGLHRAAIQPVPRDSPDPRRRPAGPRAHRPRPRRRPCPNSAACSSTPTPRSPVSPPRSRAASPCSDAQRSPVSAATAPRAAPPADPAESRAWPKTPRPADLRCIEAAGQHHAHVRCQRPQAAEHLVAIQPWHRHVEQHRAHLGGVRRIGLHRLAPIDRREHPKPRPLEHPPRDRPHPGLVVGDQHQPLTVVLPAPVHTRSIPA